MRLKKDRVYAIDDLMAVYDVTRNTISNWIKAGLRPSDSQTPRVFRGATVIAFHAARRKRAGQKLRPGEFKCLRCKVAVYPDPETVVAKFRGRNNQLLLAALCPECDGRLSKLVSISELELIKNNSNPNTSRTCAHEEKCSGPAGIGIGVDPLWSPNDRIISNWQRRAGKYSEKTIDKHLHAIRSFEEFLDCKPFEKLRADDISRFREMLKASSAGRDGAGLSKSTVQHIASHVREFLTWLLTQVGLKHLPKDLPDYLELPKAFCAAPVPRDPKPFPTIEEAKTLLMSLPHRTLLQKRQRAIFALAFLGALRADTLISLQIQHIDIARKRILQDASVSRTKNGKSLKIGWFRIPDLFGACVVEWIGALTAKGLRPDDALFPENQLLQTIKSRGRPDGPPIQPMSSIHAVTKAFADACKDHHTYYTPHAAKHTIAAERDKRSLTHEERKAWSENMGHETEHITDTYYGKLSEARRLELLEAATESVGTVLTDSLSDAELAGIMRRILSELGLSRKPERAEDLRDGSLQR